MGMMEDLNWLSAKVRRWAGVDVLVFSVRKLGSVCGVGAA